MTGEIRNPAKLPIDLNPAEEQFVRCLAEGKTCTIGDGELPKKAIESGEGANVVRSEVIRFFAYGGNEENPVSGSIISLHGAWISGGLNFAHARIPYALHFSNCHFTASVTMLYMKCAALYLDGSRLAVGLNADGLMTKGNVNLRGGFSAEGEVRLLGASIGGDLSCVGGTFHNPDGNVFFADRLTTTGNVNLGGGFSAKGMVRLPGANIGGDLNCVGGIFHNPGEYALVANGLAVRGSVYLRQNFSAKGIVQILNANIGGILDCTGGEFHNPNGNALVADGVTIKGDVNLGNGFLAEGAVQLLDANIGRSLNCVGGKFHNSDKDALSADRLTTKGNVHLREGFSAKGEVRLLGANIGGDLSCVDGKFHNSGGNALVADGLTTKGSVHLNKEFSAEGEVRLLGANIGGNLDCVDGKFHNPGGKALNIDNGNIGGALLWRGTTCEGDVNLTCARADVLVDDSGSWESCKVALNGFTYNRFIGPVDVQSRLRWLAKRPDGIRFSPLPYEQAAKVLFDMGHDNEAREILLKKERIRMRREEESDEIFSPVSHDAAANILFAMGQHGKAREILLERERLLTKRGKLPLIWKWGREIWDALAGYGYRPGRRTFILSIKIIVIGTVVFGCGEHAGRIVPHQPASLVSSKYQYGRIPAETPDETVARKFSGYPEFNPFLFSVDIFVPFLNLHQEPFWYPAPDGGRQHWWRRAEDGEFSWWFLLEWWYWYQIIAGWVLTSFFLLSIARFLRPRSSGERD